MKKEHGEHNKILCDKLYSEKTHNDWVITTAFYSAIHFIDHKIFPFDFKGNKINNIGDAHKNNSLRKESRHETRRFLVSLQLPSQVANYKYLKDNCMHARYIDYRVEDAMADRAKECLESLMAECLS